MNVPFFIAKRYLFSKKKQNIINIISGISIAGIIVGIMALIIVLSVLNGFSNLIDNLFSSFDPDIKITAIEGKMFNPKDYQQLQQVKNLPEIAEYAQIVEEVGMLKYGNQQYFATIKGVPDNFNNYTNIDQLMVSGNYLLHDNKYSYAIVGQGVAISLAVGINFIDPIKLYVPKKGKKATLNLAQSLNMDYIYPVGIFSILEEIDTKYIIVPYNYAKKLFDSEDNISAIEIKVKENTSVKTIQNKIEKIVGKSFHVKNKHQQHDLIFKTMKSEKLAAYLILLFILIIASFNILSSLSMLIIDKKQDIAIMRSFGADKNMLKKIFLLEGWLISFIGAFIGSLLGILICYLQIKYEIVQLPGNQSFVISAYPVKVVFTDVLMVFFGVFFIGIIASWYPVRYISKKYISNQNL